MVDIISGTSAGGINGIFLAKAMANGQSLDQLRKLWVTEGDAGKLLNDKASLQGGLPPGLYENPPPSLLNGQRFYWELLDALEGMEPSDGKKPAADVDEIDLYVTATDFYGLRAPLTLSDKVVEEPIHRKSFHFRLWQRGGQKRAQDDFRDDFERDLNPMLAFAARCTASFPAAFAPFKLKDIDAALENHSAYQGERAKKLGSGRTEWKERFFNGYPEDYADRYFVDGGYLDNKPFDLALGALSSRHHVLLPNERVLLYIEPDPERAGGATRTERPDVVAAVLAVDSLPRSEPIRNEVDAIAARNVVYERASLLTAGIEEDVATTEVGRQTVAPATDWAKHDLADLIKERGLAYGGYHRLKIARINDWLADCLERAKCAPAQSLATLRDWVRQWREATYVRYREGDKLTENRLLIDLDIAYRLRRIEMVRIKLSEILSSPECAHETFALSRIKTRTESGGWGSARRTLLELQGKLQDVHQDLLALNRACRALSATLAPEMQAAVDAFTTGPKAETAEALLRVMAPGVASRLTTISESCRAHLDPHAGDDSYLETARHTLRHFYDHYDDFDLVGFPMLYCLGTDELRPVSISRVSAADTSLAGELKAEKLAGVKLGHFGAFLDPEWRAHDIVWGRLDGAERIIAAVTAKAPKEIVDQRGKFMDAAFIAVTADVQGPGVPPPTTRKEIEERVKSLTTNEPLAPRTTLDLLGRSTAVVRRLLGGVAEQRGVEKKVAVAWTLRLLAVIWGVVELAIPKSLGQILIRYWLQLAMLCGFMLGGIGVLFDLRQERRIGALLAVAAIGAALAGLGLTRLIERKEKDWRVRGWWFDVAGAAAGLAILGLCRSNAEAPLPGKRGMLDLELAGTYSRLNDVLNGCVDKCVTGIAHAINWDWAVIAGYLLTLVGLSFLNRAWFRWAGWHRAASLAKAVALAVGVAATADALENAGMWLSLRLREPGAWPWLTKVLDHLNISGVRESVAHAVPTLTFGFSTLKWGLLSVAVAFNVCGAVLGIGVFVARQLARLRALWPAKAAPVASGQPTTL